MSDNSRAPQSHGDPRQGPSLDALRSTDDQPGARTPRAKRIDTGSEWFWPIVNLLGLVCVVAINALANIIPFNGITTGEVVNRNPVYFQPAGWTFSIWSLIYLLLAVFVVYSFLPVSRHDARIRRIAPVFLASNILNALWLVLWHWEQWAASTIVLALLLVALALIYYLLRRGIGRNIQPPPLERLMVWTPFSVYFGWATIAVLANIAVWLDRTGADLWGMDGRWTAVVFILAALVATAVMAVLLRDPAYALVVTWALVGLTAEQWDRSLLVAITAMIAAVLAAALALFGSLLAFEQRAAGHELPQPEARRRSRWNPFARRSPSEARENGNR